jgi:DNA-binding MarR family transcriptional regulator
MTAFKNLAESRLRYQLEPWRKLDVPLAQLKSLFLIHINVSISVHDLAVALGVTPGDVTSITDRLVGQGLVKRVENTEDRRIVLLQLTDKGRETITRIHEPGPKPMKRCLVRMDRNELTALVTGVKAFLKAMKEDYREMSAKQSVNNSHVEISSPKPEQPLHHQTLSSA